MVAFAGNSLLCRLALAHDRIDAASFTAVRLVSGAFVLALLALGRPRAPTRANRWPSALALFVYAAPFSWAYLRLPTGVGALVLFGAVQATMLGWGIARGERPRPLVWVGIALALGGLVALALPGADAPDPIGLVAMAIAGVGWGAYSLRGRTSAEDPLVATAANFLHAVPWVAVLVGIAAVQPAGLRADATGITLALASGALASGVGYSLWYAALRGLTATRAAIVQLLVPVLAAAGGAIVLHERVDARLLFAGAAVLVGVAIAIRARTRAT